MAKKKSMKTDERNLVDCEDDFSSQNTLSHVPHEQEQLSTGSEDLVISNSKSKDEVGDNGAMPHHESRKFIKNVNAMKSLDGETIDQVSAITLGSSVLQLCSDKSIPDTIHSINCHSFALPNIPDIPILSEESDRILSMFMSSPVTELTTSLESGCSHNDSKDHSVPAPSMESSVSRNEPDQSSDLKFISQESPATNALFVVNSKFLFEIDDSGYGGGPFSAAATAVLDFIAEIISDSMTEQIKAALVIETILENIPLYIDSNCLLVFQGLCLTRVMNFLERRILRDDEEYEKKLDKSRWSSNLDALCWIIVDRVFMGAFPHPASVLKILEFLLSMLQLASKDGLVEEPTSFGKGILSIRIGSWRLDAYVHALLKNTNRMILYCFSPSFLTTIGENNLILRLGLENEPKELAHTSEEDNGIDICDVLQLIVAHRQIIFCPCNPDPDLNSCLCINLISLLHDQRQRAKHLAVDIIKYLLVHRRATLEEYFISKPNQDHLDVLHGGFDKILTESLISFFEWFGSSEQIVTKVLEQRAIIIWVQYVSELAKFRGTRIKCMEGRRTREMMRRSRDISKLNLRHMEQVNERRYALEVVRIAMATELRVVRQDKYGWVLHAESEWQIYFQELVHERGIFSMPTTKDPEWQLCPIEGPYRMRKKLERCKFKINTIKNVFNEQFESFEAELSGTMSVNTLNGMDAISDSFLHLLTDDRAEQNECIGDVYDGSLFKEPDYVKDIASPMGEWNDDEASSLNDTSLHPDLEFCAQSNAASVLLVESLQEQSYFGYPIQSSGKIGEVQDSEDTSNKILSDNGEYLIRPYLEPLEKIRFKYNCERVVGLDKHDGIFLIGELSLYVIENFYVDDSGCVCEKKCEDDLSVIDQALGVKKNVNAVFDLQSKSASSWGNTVKSCIGGRAWAYNGKEKVTSYENLPHLWHMWMFNSVYEILKRDYQLRPVAIEIFSMDGCNDLLVFHKKEREEVFKNLVALNLPRNRMLQTTISGSTNQDNNEGNGLFKIMAKSFSKRWQNGEISNFQYLMHLNTLAGRGYSDLTQYPVFPWVLADYESENLNLLDPKTFRRLDKPMGCQTEEGAAEFKKRYQSWADPEIPKFHYGSHYSSAAVVLFYLVRLPPFSAENQKLQGGQFDHADRLFNGIKDTWLSASGKGNTSDVKELIPEFFYMPEFLKNRSNLDLGEKQSGVKVDNVVLPPWAKSSVTEFIRKHREALESDFVSENLHNWIDLIFGYKQRGKAAVEALNVFYYCTYEGSVDLDSITDPSMKASILAQINNFGQTPKQLFLTPHVKRQSVKKLPCYLFKHAANLVPHLIRGTSSSIAQIATFHEKVLFARTNCLLKPRTYTEYVAWGFPDRSLRFMSYDQNKLLSTHENLHRGNRIQCAGFSHDGQILATGADDGLVSIWRIFSHQLVLEKSLCGHTERVGCVRISQAYMLIVTGSDDHSVIIWDLSSLTFVRQLPEFVSPVFAIFVNDLNGEIATGSGALLGVWTVNGDRLAVVNASERPSDFILSVAGSTFSDWFDMNWYVTGHQSGDIKVWQMVYCSEEGANEYRLILRQVLKFHNHPVTALHVTSDFKQLLSGDSDGRLLSWTVPDKSLKGSSNHG